jgi:hypothetical protein
MEINSNYLRNPNDLYAHLRINKDLVTGFMIMFSYFEYVLKRTKYRKKEGRDGVKPDWDKFARDYASLFNVGEDIKLRDAVTYLLDNPPKRQVITSKGELDFNRRNLNSNTTLEKLVCSLRGVRNNLFHGGKFESGSVEDPARNTILLESCITILNKCITLDKDVEQYFWIYQQ